MISAILFFAQVFLGFKNIVGKDRTRNMGKYFKGNNLKIFALSIPGHTLTVLKCVLELIQHVFYAFHYCYRRKRSIHYDALKIKIIAHLI